MANPSPTRAASADDAGERERLTRLARLISHLFSPAALALPSLMLSVYVSHEPGAWRYAVVYLLVAVVVPVADILWMVHTGRISDFHLSRREERRRPFMVGTVCTALGLLAYQVLGAPPIMIAIAQATVLQTVVLFAITLRWQISVHMATITSIVTFLLLAFGKEALAFVLLLPLVGWARWYLRRHTVPQLVAGGIVGVTAMLVCLDGVLY